MKTIADIDVRLMQGGGVPGGHYVIADRKKQNYFITPMKECHSIPLLYTDVVVDIGAYVGTFAIYCARFPVRQVIAYEPTPQTFAVLGKTTLFNLQAKQMAVVGDNRSDVQLFLSSGIGVTNSVVMANRKAGRVNVPAIQYESAIQAATIVKIDVEGAEYTYKNLVHDKLRAIIIDFHPVAGNWIKRAREMIESIESAGFRSVIAPNFNNGWTRAGSWMRDVKVENIVCDPLLSGEFCCGCGREVKGDGKTLCQDCWNQWLPKHRQGFKITKSNDSEL